VTLQLAADCFGVALAGPAVSFTTSSDPTEKLLRGKMQRRPKTNGVAIDLRVTAKNGDNRRFTIEEAVLLRGLATGSSITDIAGRLRLPRAWLFRVLRDLRTKTGAPNDVALAVWALRNMESLDRRSDARDSNV
jgi:DNA-binding NarL/FixJ family response regulator